MKIKELIKRINAKPEAWVFVVAIIGHLIAGIIGLINGAGWFFSFGFGAGFAVSYSILLAFHIREKNNGPE